MIHELKKVEELVSGINEVHKKFSDYYFDCDEKKINLAKTIRHIPFDHIRLYRLNLHESINDYIWELIQKDLRFLYRVKTMESLTDKIERFSQKENQYPVSNWLNDIFGARIIVKTELYNEIRENLSPWEEKLGLKNWYEKGENAEDGYKALHVYFKNKLNYFFPWELQIWDEKNIETNIQHHRMYKRGFVK
ncbi:MAG: GTP pyrophosphokinase [Chitinivibrionia bacterium]|nr:GTP pyrophosphokinase [Chitinivibrionia bacterium]